MKKDIRENRQKVQKHVLKHKKTKPINPLKRMSYLILWIAIVVMFVGLLISQVSRYNELSATLSHVQWQLEREVERQEELYLQLTFFDNDLYIQQLARELLGWIFPDEIIFINIGTR